MRTLKFLFSKTLLSYLWQEALVRYRFKYVLPKITETQLDGIRLDMSKLSLRVRNRLLMGIYEAHEKQLCHEFLTSKDSVLEIGGAIGFIGLFCQKKIGIKDYSIFEANPDTLAILRANYELNGLRPAAWNLALAPFDGEVDLEVASDFWENSIVPRGAGANVGNTVRVPCAVFSSMIRHVSHPFNVLIIDVEGAEQFIDLDDIPEEVNKVIIELHPTALGPATTYQLIAGLMQRGFQVAREEAGTFAFIKEPSLHPNVRPHFQHETRFRDDFTAERRSG